MSLLGFLRSYEAQLSHHSEIRGIAIVNAMQLEAASLIICQICDKKGHSTLSCNNRHNEQHLPSKNEKSRPRFRYNRGSNTPSPAANAIWYPNSGASDHVSSDPQCIQTSDAAPPSRTLTVANGNSLQIDYTGSSNYLLAHKNRSP